MKPPRLARSVGLVNFRPYARSAAYKYTHISLGAGRNYELDDRAMIWLGGEESTGAEEEVGELGKLERKSRVKGL